MVLKSAICPFLTDTGRFLKISVFRFNRAVSVPSSAVMEPVNRLWSAVSTDCCAQTESVSYGTASKQGN